MGLYTYGVCCTYTGASNLDTYYLHLCGLSPVLGKLWLLMQFPQWSIEQWLCALCMKYVKLCLQSSAS